MKPKIWAGSGASLELYLSALEKYHGEQPRAAVEAAIPSHIAQQFDLDADKDKGRLGLLALDADGKGNATLNISGSLVARYAWWHEWFPGEITSYEVIQDAVDILLESKDTKNVLIQVDSPGGMVTGLDVAGKSLELLAKRKEVRVHVDNLAASAGYWLATAPKAPLTASRMAEVGSIGVIAIYEDYSKWLEEEGIKYHVIHAGKEKAYGFGGTAFSEEELASLQKSVDITNNFFLTHVSKARNIQLSDSEKWAEGKVFYAGEAKSVGLIDEVSDLSRVIGSFTAANPKKGETMIPDEKLAQILAGAAPETVLTPEELKVYQASLAEATKEDPATAEAPIEQPVAKAEEPVEEPVDVATAKALGKLEATIEFKDAEIAKLTEKLAEAEANTQSLLEVAQAAVTNLQVALQQPKEQKGSVAGVLAQYNELQELRAQMFKTGRQSSATNLTKENSENNPDVPHPLRFNL